jgi:hypothetical protein
MYARELVDRSWNFNYSSAKQTTAKPLCQRVEGYFQFPPRRLCRYFADADDSSLIAKNGLYFRGFHASISVRNFLPKYLFDCFFHPLSDLRGTPTFQEMVAFDNLIYIRPGTCDDPTGLVETYAHELQHFVQHGNTPRLLAVNNALRENLKTFRPDAIATDVPSERDANIISKFVAESVCGVEAVRAFAEEQIRLMDANGLQEEKARWIFFRDVPSSSRSYFVEGTLAMVEEYKTRIDFGMDTDKPEWWVGPIDDDED